MALVIQIIVSKIKIEDIRKAAIEQGWTVISESYKNLNEPMDFECEEGHKVYLPYKNIRNKWECPICKQNKYYNFNTELPPKKKNIQRTLGLDQATHVTGYSVFDGSELIYAGTFKATADDEIERDIQVRNWLSQMIINAKIDIVGLEGIQLQQFNNKMVGVTTYQTLARLQGILMSACCDQKVDYVICPPATWRAHCGVKGRSRADQKKSMQNLIKKWFDITVSDDVADAIGIGKYVNETHKKKIEIFNWE